MRYSDIIVVVMAAGQSSRFGSDKRVAKLGNGETLLSSTLLTVQQCFTDIYIVIKPDEGLQSLGLPSQTPTIMSQHSHLGLGYSISDAFKQLCSDKNMDNYRAAAIWLADLPWINRQTCSLLAGMATPDTILQPSYRGELGHPVIFGTKFWKDLSQLKSSRGASSIIKRHSNSRVSVPVNDPGVCSDIDYPADILTSFKRS